MRQFEIFAARKRSLVTGGSGSNPDTCNRRSNAADTAFARPHQPLCHGALDLALFKTGAIKTTFLRYRPLPAIQCELRRYVTWLLLAVR